MRHFEVYIMGSMYSTSLYNADGGDVFNLTEATQLAEDQHGGAWREVCNGTVAMTRDEYLDLPGT